MATTAIDRLSGQLLDSIMLRNVSVAEAVKITGLSERAIRGYVASGRLRSVKLGKRRLLRYRDVLEFANGGKNR